MTDTPKITFAELNLDPRIQSAIDAAGYDHPTPIQEQAIPVIKKGGDVTGIAQTGTGKTAAFTLPMMHRLTKGRARARMPRSLILCPTRELAAQVAENFETYGKDLKLEMALLIGGVSFKEQEQKLNRGVDVLIATPGRLIDQFERGKILLTGVEVFTIDEADRMLDMGFIPDIEKIFKLTPMTRQTLFFSATMPPEIQRITDQFLHQPTRVEVSKPATTADTITQNIVRIPSKDDKLKRNVLRELLRRDDVKNGIIFCNRKSTVDIVAKSLQKHGFDARPIHGDLAQAFRTETLDKFRNDELQFLVASDVAARGLDIPAVSHVFNFDVPIHSDDYVHRIGRTGRAGRKGATFMLVTPADGKHLDSILKTIGAKEIEELDFSKFFEENPVAERRPRGGKAEKSGKSEKDGKGRRPSRRGRKSDQDEAKNADASQADQPAEASAHDDGDKGQKSSNSNNQRGSSRRRGGEPRPSRRREEAVVGLGDHVPAFLTRQVAR